jgi:tryptophanyl-tRNA synthetase
MTNSEILSRANSPHNVVYEFEKSKLLHTFLLKGNNPSVVFILEENLEISEALPDLQSLERLSELLTDSYEAIEINDALSILDRGGVQYIILDESVFDNEWIYLKTEGRNSVIRIRPDDLRNVLENLKSKQNQLVIYDFGYTATQSTTEHRVISGIQPSGDMTLGNYLGAIINWKKQIKKYKENLFFIADLHSLTTLPNPADLRDRIYKTVITLVACGLDLEKAVIFRQSDLGGYHTELSWIFSCLTPEGRLEQMTQFKEKAKKQQIVGAGLKTYPILMTADIALYQATLVPVGDDQRQHLELSREIIRRFNSRYGYTFPVPKSETPQVLARVMSLTDGTKKMSKSDEERDSCIYLLDSANDISRKVKRAKTDSNPALFFDKSRPEISNLLGIYQVLTGLEKEDIEDKLKGQGAATLKNELTEILIESLRPIQNKYNEILTDPNQVIEILKKGKERAEPIAEQTLSIVKKRVGL